MERKLGAQISHMLRDRGVEVIFGIPGVHNQELYRGIEESGLEHVLARHEQGAGFMADGYARATGRVGVAYVITGPGLTNIMTPMGQAYSDSVPILVISSCLDETSARLGQLHQMKDQRLAAETVCDWSEEARSAESAYQLIERAFLEFETQRLRPKHIQVPISVLETEAPPARRMVENRPMVVNAIAQEREIAKLLKDAEKPLFILGGGACETDLFDEALNVIKPAGAMVMTTAAGRGIMPKDYPLNLGACLARPESAELIGLADLVVAVGTAASEVDLWRDSLGHTSTFVRIDIDPAMLTDHHDADIRILGDARAILSGIAKQLGEDPTPSLWTEEQVEAAKSRWRAQTNAERPGIMSLVDALREAAPRDTMFFSDMTQFAYVANEVFELEYPLMWHHPSGFGSLGYGLPASIGGKIGVGEKPVISISGDSGFQYNLQELATAVELGLSLPIIVWDNGKLGEIEDSMTRAQIAPNAVVARNPDFCKLAESYGALSAAPRSLASFQMAVREALLADKPTLIHITPETGVK